MSEPVSHRKRKAILLAVGVLVTGALVSPASANPNGATVAQGTATFSSQGPQLTIQTSDRAFINWQNFNIGLGETTSFVQPSSSSLVWNQINDANPSQILGNLNANGYVVLQNPSGFFIGGQASITAHGLLMTTAPIRAPDITSGGAWQFNAPPPTASIVNYGQVKTDRGGSLFLIASDVQNHGTLSSEAGTVGLYAGKDVLVSERPDGRGLSAEVTLPAGSVDNSGKIIAESGTIAMHAQVVNQGGVVQANSVREVNGSIELVASDAIHLGQDSRISASGGGAGESAGGSVSIKSSGEFSDETGSIIDVSGGSTGGDGGSVHVSAPEMTSFATTISARAQSSFSGGVLKLDPKKILLSSTGDSAPGSGVVNAGDPPSSGSPDTLTLDVNSFNNLINQSGLSQISLEATDLIELQTLWSLPDSADPGATLTLRSGNNIVLDPNSAISAGNNWSVQLYAGTDTSVPTGSGRNYGIYLDGNSYVQTRNGNIDLWAAKEVLVATGSAATVGNNGIRTVAGGNINVTTLFGDVNSGGNTQGYNYNGFASHYSVSLTLGGISTAAGGNVTIHAGGDVISYLPVSSSGGSATADAGTGAFGSEPGNVEIAAGGSVFGHYVLANGTGSITAGQNVGGPTTGSNLALSLINGDWNVSAPNGNIYLQEVRNPNGTFNRVGGSGRPGFHLFDYGADAGVHLDAGDGVFLTGLGLPRPVDPVPVIMPPVLDVSAGAGGITLQDSFTLFPSAAQDLHLETTDGGSLVTRPNDPNRPPSLVMSDSGKNRWLQAGDFGTADHAAVPPNLNATEPAVIDISGNIQNMAIYTTKATSITVGGDMIDSSFSGQNLHSGDSTSINVAGEIRNRSPYAFVILDMPITSLPASALPPNAASNWQTVFSQAVDPNRIAGLTIPGNIGRAQYAQFALDNAGLFAGNPGFVYDETTHRLGYIGPMPTSFATLLEMPLTVLRYGADGVPLLDSQGHFVTQTFSFATPDGINALYLASLESASPNDSAQFGYRIGGPGTFDIHAGSISLGNTYGIVSAGVADPTGGGRYSNLAPFTPVGATVNVTVENDLEMLTSTVAAIGGGDVNVRSLNGAIDLGTGEVIGGHRPLAQGIFSSGRGNVSVEAYGDVDVNGSRIAAYNGGDVRVVSDHGDVNAGSGGTVFVSVPVTYVDPETGEGTQTLQKIFGSGILASTLVDTASTPGSAVTPGDITVETPEGSIRADRGGIVQVAFNGNVSAGPTINLKAGSPGHIGDVDLGDSGVIGGTVNIDASGDVTGLVISRQDSNVRASQSFSGTVLSGGSASLNAGGTIAGTVIGVTGVNASGGGGISANLVSQNVSANGAAAASTLGTSAAATSTSQAAAQQASNDTKEKIASNSKADGDDDDDKKKKKKKPTLTKRVGRVQVILPKKNTP